MSLIKLKHNFEARVLTNGSWPTFKNESLIIPIEVSNSMNIFSEYYLNKNSSHKLTWYHQMDDILLSGIFLYIERIFLGIDAKYHPDAAFYLKQFKTYSYLTLNDNIIVNIIFIGFFNLIKPRKKIP